MVDEIVRSFTFVEKRITGAIIYTQGMLERFVIPVTRHCPIIVFQLDSVSPQWSLDKRDCLDERFPEPWIGLDGPIGRSARSPDLIPCDFFIASFIKYKVSKTKIRSMNELSDK